MQIDTLERIIPGDVDQETLSIHLERYRFASNYLIAGRILDIACGVGYGANELVKMRESDISSIIAVDLSLPAIEYARKKYRHPKISFVHADAMTFQTGELFDSIISLETIEHLRDPAQFVQRLRGMLSENGVLIASVPVTPSIDVNPYHVTDFTADSFRKLFEAEDLKEMDSLLQSQPYHPFKVLQGKSLRTSELRPGLVGYYVHHPAAFVKRMVSTVRDGFNNKYLTLVLCRQV